MNVRYTRRALAQLEEVHGYLAPRSATGACKVTASLQATFARLIVMPHLGRSTDQDNVLVFIEPDFKYRVFYTIDQNTVVVLRILHRSRRTYSNPPLRMKKEPTIASAPAAVHAGSPALLLELGLDHLLLLGLVLLIGAQNDLAVERHRLQQQVEALAVLVGKAHPEIQPVVLLVLALDNGVGAMGRLAHGELLSLGCDHPHALTYGPPRTPRDAREGPIARLLKRGDWGHSTAGSLMRNLTRRICVACRQAGSRQRSWSAWSETAKAGSTEAQRGRARSVFGLRQQGNTM
jgi:plasmid stabilization system protein ParE